MMDCIILNILLKLMYGKKAYAHISKEKIAYSHPTQCEKYFNVYIPNENIYIRRKI